MGATGKLRSPARLPAGALDAQASQRVMKRCRRPSEEPQRLFSPKQRAVHGLPKRCRVKREMMDWIGAVSLSAGFGSTRLSPFQMTSRLLCQSDHVASFAQPPHDSLTYRARRRCSVCAGPAQCPLRRGGRVCRLRMFVRDVLCYGLVLVRWERCRCEVK